MENRIPQQVIDEAQKLIDRYGSNLVFLGNSNGLEYYVFRFPKDSITGFPFVYVYHPQLKKVTEMTGFDALDILGKFHSKSK